jgi:hypothetical protein
MRCERCGKKVDRLMSVTNKKAKKADGVCLTCACKAIYD